MKHKSKTRLNYSQNGSIYIDLIRDQTSATIINRKWGLAIVVMHKDTTNYRQFVVGHKNTIKIFKAFNMLANQEISLDQFQEKVCNKG